MGEDFIGREVDMYRVLRCIARRRLVVVCSSKKLVANHGRGIGKSALVLGVAHRLQQRKYGCSQSAYCFKDGVILIRGVASIADICKQWIDQLKKNHCRIRKESFSQQQQHQLGAPPVINADRGSIFQSNFDENIRGNNTPLIVQLMRLARLTQNCLVIIDNCAAELTIPGSEEALCLNNFLCGLLQSLPKLRILLTAPEPPFIIEKNSTKHIQVNHSFKPQIICIGGLSNMASARLLLRRSHRKISLAEALNGSEYPSNSQCQVKCEDPNQIILMALSRHPLILKLNGHPCEILKVALRVTNDLPSIDILLSEKYICGGAQKTKSYGIESGMKINSAGLGRQCSAVKHVNEK